MDNMYSPEDALTDALECLVNDDMIFTEERLPKLTKDTFKEISEESEKVAIVILYSGYKLKSKKSRGRGALISPLWRVLVVTPSELYKSLAGVKLMEVISKLQGLDIDGNGKCLELEDDVREFNTPDFLANLFAIPSVFSFDVVV